MTEPDDRAIDPAIEKLVATALNHRLSHDRHLHHRDCIHNMPPMEQVEVRGHTVEWWLKMVGPLPEQITPDEWECESPFSKDGEQRP